MPEITHILQSLERGEARAADELLPLVYEELRRLAAQKMAGEPSGQTLQATALVHEAWLRLVRTQEQTWQNRAHFFRTAAESMRRILIDNARRKNQVRHGGGQRRVPRSGGYYKDISPPPHLDPLLRPWRRRGKAGVGFECACVSRRKRRGAEIIVWAVSAGEPKIRLSN